jgi:raffinose/stachyose/melibiose transport system permease protein
MSAVRRRIRLRAVLRNTFLTLFAIPWVGIPVWMVLVNSAKSTPEAGNLGLGLPSEWHLFENYATVITEGDYPTALRNSLLIVLPAIALTLMFGSLAAWAYARSSSIGMRVAYNVTILTILLPPALLPTIYVLGQIGLQGTSLGYVVVTVGVRLGLVVFLMVGFIRQLPPSLEEAAQVDGASRLSVYWHIILPLTRPVLFVGGVLLAISVWNEFFFASFLLTSGDQATLPLALFQFSSQGGAQVLRVWNLIFAHVVLTSLPLVLVYVFAQKRVIAGLTEGGVQG